MSRLDEPVTEPAAYVLPLHRRDDDSGWASADWQLRRGRIVLLEGDSPAGLRLPLNSISWEPPPPAHHADPLTRSGTTLRRRNRGRRRAGRGRRCRAHHRDGRRDPRRVAVHLPAADRGTRALHRPDQPRRSGRRQGRLPRGGRRLRPAARSADRLDDDHARPGRHRGQRRADGQFRRADASSWRPSTSRPAWPACPPSRSTSTARTAAPAAATTSRSAASRPPIRRCCAAPTCWCRC